MSFCVNKAVLCYFIIKSNFIIAFLEKLYLCISTKGSIGLQIVCIYLWLSLVVIIIGVANYQSTFSEVCSWCFKILVVAFVIACDSKVTISVQRIYILCKIKPKCNLISYIFQEYNASIIAYTLVRITAYKEVS